MGFSNTKKPGLRIASWVVTLFCGVVLCFVGCKKEQPAATSSSPHEVSVITITPQDVPVVAEYVAQTQSSHLVNIQARVSGFLGKRLYTEGTMVQKGQVLFQMDAKPFQVQLDQAKAALAKQEAALETARLNLARIKPLTLQNALSQKDLDDATGQHQSAAAAVEQAKAQMETAKLNLSYTTITSPVAGLSSSARQTDGAYINPQNSLLTTVEVVSPMWVNFSISENEMQRHRDQVTAGFLRTPKDGAYMVEIILSDGSVFPHTGRITFAEPSYNPQTGTFLIRASVENPDGLLRSNQYVRARLKGAIRPNAILVPQRAVSRGAKGQFVWVVSGGNTAEHRPVMVGGWHGDQWFILEGLHKDDLVVVDGGLTLQPGMAVTATPVDASSNPPAETSGAKADETLNTTSKKP